MKIAIRVDGGSDIGFGHLVRATSLGEVLNWLGIEITYATTTPHNTRSVAGAGCEIVELPSRSDPTPFCEWLDSTAGDVDGVFADCYPVDTAYQQAIRERVPLAVHDDDGRHQIAADILINGNIFAEDIPYQTVGDVCRLIGPEYLLIDKSIRELTTRDPPWRGQPKRAIISLGGSDVARLTPTVIDAFDGLGLEVDIVVGPGFDDEQEQEIRAVSDKISAKTTVICDPDDLSKRFFQADIAVTTCGSTVYELLALGTPMVCFPVVDNQNQIASALKKRDAATVLTRDPDPVTIRTSIEAYLSEPDLRRSRRSRGRELVDGQGAVRVGVELASRWKGMR